MARIKCKTPSTGRPVNFIKANLGTEWTTIAEAPDFSVPDTSNSFPNRDPLDLTRAVRAGEVFFLTPMFARNKTADSCWIEIRIVMEDGTTVECPGRLYVPGMDTSMVPMQGRSIVKRTMATATGDKIQARAEAANRLDLWVSGEEKLSSEHIGVTA